MLAEVPFAILAAGAVLVGLWISNIMYDLKVPQYISRKIGHIAGGVGFLICAYLFKSGWWPFILSAGFTLVLFAARYLKPDTFRGVGGAGRGKEAFSEVWFPLSAAILFAVGWLWLNRPVETVACLLFMAWGDAITGLVRSQVYHKAVKGVWGSVAMLVTCLVISWCFITPFWVGALAAVVATGVEYISGDVSRLKFMHGLDDNVTIPLVAAAIVLALI
jgi:phytol kinase